MDVGGRATLEGRRHVPHGAARRALVACLAALVAACGGGGDASSGSTSGSNEPPPPPPAPVLTVTRTGTGSGSVTSSPAGIACGSTCQQAYSSGTAVTLTATADPGSAFGGWSGGGCSGTGTCQVAVTAATTVTATFDRSVNGPFTVRQTETLGGETISGSVCDLAQPFTVLAVAPNVTWNFVFVPLDATHGQVTYSYSIPSAGETHDASGTYRVGAPAQDGTLVLSMAVSDHVTFHGFDGNIPLSYQFSLVPAVKCP